MSQMDRVKQIMTSSEGYIFLEVSGTKQLIEECGSNEAAGRFLGELVTLTNNPVMLIEPQGVQEDKIMATFLAPRGWIPSYWERFFERIVDPSLSIIGLTTLGYCVWYTEIGEGIEQFQVELGGPGAYRQRTQL